MLAISGEKNGNNSLSSFQEKMPTLPQKMNGSNYV